MPSGFDVEGDWLRCQFHSHTTNSDGEATTDELIGLYAGHGYDVLAITDHHFVTQVADDRLVLIPSSELTASPRDGMEADILALGCAELPDPNRELGSIEEAASFIVANGGVAILAHPYWSGLESSDYLNAPSLNGVEVVNGGSHVANGNGVSAEFWDAVLYRTKGVAVGIATDDCHYPGTDSNLGWTMVRCAERTREAVLDALRAGACYGSTGAEILDLQVTADGVEVRCSPATAVTLRSGPWDGGRVHADAAMMQWRGEVLERDAAGLVTAARMLFPETWPWGRVEVENGDARAWSNPFALPLSPGGPQSASG